MILLKSAKEIKIMQEGGRKLAGVMEKILAKVKPGLKLKEIERLTTQLIEKEGGKPSFKMVKDYHWTTCLNVNQGVVHGIPTDYHLKEGDLLSVDMGMFYQGLHTDMSRTICVRTQSSIPKESRKTDKCKIQNEEFLEAGRRALAKAIRVARPGNRLGHISQVIETEIERNGFSPVRVLFGHGVGKKLHEEPAIPCYLDRRIETTEKLKSGMTLAIEVIYVQGKPELVIGKDGWTIETADGQLASLFENTMAITKKGPLVLTQI